MMSHRIWEAVPAEAKDLIVKMLTRDIAHRLSAEQILHHSFFKVSEPCLTPSALLIGAYFQRARLLLVAALALRQQPRRQRGHVRAGRLCQRVSARAVSAECPPLLPLVRIGAGRPPLHCLAPQRAQVLASSRPQALHLAQQEVLPSEAQGVEVCEHHATVRVCGGGGRRGRRGRCPGRGHTLRHHAGVVSGRPHHPDEHQLHPPQLPTDARQLPPAREGGARKMNDL